MATTHWSRYRVKNGKICIELKLKNIKQLFNSLDPSPFIERDLDENAVEYILSSVMEHRQYTPLMIRVHVVEPIDREISLQVIRESIRNYFRYESDLVRRKMRHTFRQGQVSLIFALVVLFSCLTVARLVFGESGSHPSVVVREGLTIIGWVAMWRPMDIFLYSWRSQMEKRQFLNKLAHVDVEMEAPASVVP